MIFTENVKFRSGSGKVCLFGKTTREVIWWGIRGVNISQICDIFRSAETLKTITSGFSVNC